MRNILIITRRELAAYFSTPLAYVFIVAFLVSAGSIPFFMGRFLERGQADLQPFFSFHPWLFLVLIPAVGMRLWAEERRTGTIEFLMTLPITTWEAVLGKFIASWLFTGFALALTFPMWLTVNYLGDPDNGVILASYLGSFLVAGAFLAVGAFISALTKNQVIAFILSATACFLLVTSGMDIVQNTFRVWTPRIVSDAISSMSVLSHYDEITRGVVSLGSIVFFVSLIAFALFANAIAVTQKKSA